MNSSAYLDRKFPQFEPDEVEYMRAQCGLLISSFRSLFAKFLEHVQRNHNLPTDFSRSVNRLPPTRNNSCRLGNRKQRHKLYYLNRLQTTTTLLIRSRANIIARLVSQRLPNFSSTRNYREYLYTHNFRSTKNYNSISNKSYTIRSYKRAIDDTRRALAMAYCNTARSTLFVSYIYTTYYKAFNIHTHAHAHTRHFPNIVLDMSHLQRTKLPRYRTLQPLSKFFTFQLAPQFSTMLSFSTIDTANLQLRSTRNVYRRRRRRRRRLVSIRVSPNFNARKLRPKSKVVRRREYMHDLCFLLPPAIGRLLEFYTYLRLRRDLKTELHSDATK